MDLQQRVERLERQNRVLKLGALAVLLLAGTTVLLGAQPNPAQAIPSQLTQEPARKPEARRPRKNAKASPAKLPQEDDEPSPGKSVDGSFEVADEGGRIQGVFIIFGSRNILNLGGPNGHGPIRIGTDNAQRGEGGDEAPQNPRPNSSSGTRGKVLENRQIAGALERGLQALIQSLEQCPVSMQDLWKTVVAVCLELLGHAV